MPARTFCMLAWMVFLVPAAAGASPTDPVPDPGGAPAVLPAKPPPPAPDWKTDTYLEPQVPLAEPFALRELPPHPIIVILVDALRPDHLGYLGYPRETTPHLDAFAKEALTFTNFYVNAPWTRPSTTSILTGLHPSRHRTQCEKHKLDPRFTTLPEALKDAGYRTAGIVANGNGASIGGLDQGFDHYEDPKTFGGLAKAGQVVDHNLAWLRRHAKEDRLFLFTFVVDPHDPYRGPSPEAEARWLWKDHPEIVRIPRWEYPEGKGLSEDQRRAMIAVYDSAVHYTDAQLGRFFEGLRELGLWDKATIVVTADHGDGFGEHGFYKHAHHLWDEVVRVPFLVRSPALPEAARGRRVDALASSIDLFPTLVQLGGAAMPERRRPGKSLLEVAASPAAHADRRIISEYNCFGISRTMVRDATHKLVLQLPADEEAFLATVKRKEFLPSVIFDREELLAYDLAADPLERRSLVPGGDPAGLPAALAPLLETLRTHITTQPGGRARLIEELDPATEANLRALGYIQ